MIITEIYSDGSKQDFEGDVIRENGNVMVIQTRDGIREIPKRRLPSDFKAPKVHSFRRPILS